MEWQPIETAPEGESVLIFSENWITTAELTRTYGWAAHDGSCLLDDPPTHWMPLPEPPKESSDGR